MKAMSIQLMTLCLCMAVTHADLFVGHQTQAWDPTRLSNAHLRQENLPALSEMTFCFWHGGNPAKNPHGEIILNIAIQRSFFTIFNDPSDGLKLWVKGKRNEIKLDNSRTIWKSPHFHCFTWKAGGSFKWYVDHSKMGVMEFRDQAEASSVTIPSGGVLTLFSRRGRTYSGKWAHMSMWDFEMSADQIKALTCEDEGNLVNSNTLQTPGGGNHFEEITIMKHVESFDIYKEERMQTWIQPQSTTIYRYQENIPALSEMTYCFWFKGEPEGLSVTSRDMISIAIPGNDNAFDIYNQPLGETKILVTRGVKAELDGSEEIWQSPHSHCFTWKAGGSFKWYVDHTTKGVKELNGEAPVDSTTIPEGGTLVLLLEQDSMLGGFQLNQQYPGEWACMNVWDREMSADEVRTLTCRDQGNLVNSNTLQIAGGEEPFGEVTITEYIGTATASAEQCSADLFINL